MINNRNAPSYKAAKKLNNILKLYLNFDNYYTIDNSMTLDHDLTKPNINGHHRLMSLDIKDLYVNIPIRETIDITRQQLLKYNDVEIMLQICKLSETILQQNYFTFQDQIYQPAKGIAMGSPISGTIADIFLQYLEHIHIKPLLDSKWIVLYSQYIDDILIIYDNERTNPNTLMQYTIHECLQFHPTQESNDLINFLDLTIIKRNLQQQAPQYISYPTTLMNTNWQHTDIILKGCSTSHLMQNTNTENG